jgi:hypothetical protein
MKLRAIVPSLLMMSAALAAQPRQIRLGPADSSPDAFSRIVDARELADGRVIIADRRERRLAVVSFSGAPARAIQGVGSGTLIRMDGDSTALIEASSGRWVMLKGSEVVGMMSPVNITVRLTPFPIGITPLHAYGFVFPPGGLGATTHDTMALTRVSRGGGGVDTIALVAAPNASRSSDSSLAPKVYTVNISLGPRTAGEQASVFPDGWIAMARLRPYRVDWIDPSGRLRPGQPLLAESQDSLPPFTTISPILADLAPALKQGPAGELLIRRWSNASNSEQRYDVVDRTGQLVSQIVLPPRETLVAIGKAHLYTVKTGENGKDRLRRYVWPTR